MSLRVTIAALIAGLGALLWTACTRDRSDHETAAYETILRDGDFEVRLYEPMTLATIPLCSPSPSTDNASFRQLLAYLTGKNATGEKMPMTTPVLISQEGMSFVLPRQVAVKGAPCPADIDVSLTELPAHHYAVCQFDEGPDRVQSEAGAESELRAWIRDRGLAVSGPAIFAYYDPPWNPRTQRRNEVVIRIRDESLRDPQPLTAPLTKSVNAARTSIATATGAVSLM